MWEWVQNDGSSTCFQITTKTMSEMMTMTRSTSTAAATVSSGWGPVQDRGGGNGSHINHTDATCVNTCMIEICCRNVLYQAEESIKSLSCLDYQTQKVCLEDNMVMEGGGGDRQTDWLRGYRGKWWGWGFKANLEKANGPNGIWLPCLSYQDKNPYQLSPHKLISWQLLQHCQHQPSSELSHFQSLWHSECQKCKELKRK